MAYPRVGVGVGEMWNMYMPPDEQWSNKESNRRGSINRKGKII